MRIKLYVGGHYSGEGLVNQFDNSTLNKYLRSEKFQIEVNPKNAEFYVANDFSKKDFEIMKLFKLQKRILIISEPKVVLPGNYTQKNLRKFGLVIFKKELGMEGLFTFPQYFRHDVVFEPRENRSERVVLINSNKLSFINGNNYRLRKKCAQKISSIDLYGFDWDITIKKKTLLALSVLKLTAMHQQIPNLLYAFSWYSRFSGYKGKIESKVELMMKYTYSLIIENDNTYVSEKIFDSFFSGTIPIYVGLDLDKTLIPKNLVVEAERNVRSIKEAIKTANAIKYEDWLSNVKNWLQSPEVKNFWSEEEVYSRLAWRISEYCKNIYKL